MTSVASLASCQKGRQNSCSSFPFCKTLFSSEILGRCSAVVKQWIKACGEELTLPFLEFDSGLNAVTSRLNAIGW